MKVALSVPGKFHTFDLARELYARKALAGVYTAYPMFKLRNEGLPPELVHTFPWFLTPYMGNPWRNRMPHRLTKEMENLVATSLSSWTARHLPECDVYVGMSGSSLPAGRVQRRRGGRYVCDRGSCHIREQDRLLRKEHADWGMPFFGIDPRVIAREESEYEQADCITVPSTFALRTFLSAGIPAEKIRLLPYGVNLGRFEKTGEPDPGRFDVLFVGNMSLQKGVPYLLDAFQRLQHPAKSLKFAGTPSPQLIELLTARGLWSGGIEVLGHVVQTELKHLMSRSHVMVLPSIQEGLAMVMAQAMACGCPVIASENTGARDLLDDGQEGFIVPIRNVEALVQRMQQLADDGDLRSRMGQSALARVKNMGGWRDYGDRALGIYRGLVEA